MNLRGSTSRLRASTAIVLAAAGIVAALATADVSAVGSDDTISDGATANVRAERVRPSETPGAPFVGEMIGANRGRLVGVDLATGRSRTLPGTQRLADLGLDFGEASFQTRLDRAQQSGVVHTVDECDGSTDLICVIFTDANGNTVRSDADGDLDPQGEFDGSFALDGRFPGSTATSYDGRYVAINRTDRAVAASSLTIRRRNGDFVTSYTQNANPDDGAYDWMPDGKFVYSIESNALLNPGLEPSPTGFYIVDPLGNAPRRTITLPEFWQGGRIKTIESRPTGNQILINLEPRVGPTRPIIVDLDTLAVTQLIVREDDSVSDATNVEWGPDGEWVYVVASTSRLLSGVGLAPGSTVVFIGSFPSLFAYRVDGAPHPMPNDADDLSASVVAIGTDDIRDPQSANGRAVGGGQYVGGLTWIP